MASSLPPHLRESSAELKPAASVTLSYLQAMRREMQTIRDQHARVLELFQRQHSLVQSFRDETMWTLAEIKSDVAFLEIKNTGRRHPEPDAQDGGHAG